MDHGFFTPIMDRVVANARVVRGAPEAIALTALVVAAISYLGLQHLYRDRLTALNDRMASQERLLGDYRTKLAGASAEAAAQVEKLTKSLADAQKTLNEAKSKPAAVVDNRSRDPRRLYDGGSPVALVHDAKVELDKKRITFAAVNSEVILGINKFYEFKDWKLACGSTQLYNTISDGAAHEFSYSPLACKIVGNR